MMTMERPAKVSIASSAYYTCLLTKTMLLFSVSILVCKHSIAEAHHDMEASTQGSLLRGGNRLTNNGRNLFDLPSPFDVNAQSCYTQCNGENDAEDQNHSPFLDACPRCYENYSSQHCNSCCQGGASSLKLRWHGCLKGELTFATGFQGNEDCGLNPYAFHPFPSGYFQFIDCECYDSIKSPITFQPYGCTLMDSLTMDDSANTTHVDICVVATQLSGAIDFTQSLPELIGLVHSSTESEADQPSPTPYPFHTYFNTTCSSKGTPLFPGYGKFANSCPSKSFIDLEEEGFLRLPEDIDHFNGQPTAESFWFEFRDGTSTQFWPRDGTQDSLFYNSFHPSFSECSCVECSSTAPSPMVQTSPSNQPTNTLTLLSTEVPSVVTDSPTATTTNVPSGQPTVYFRSAPSVEPTDDANLPTSFPPSNIPTVLATAEPSVEPTNDGMSGVTESPTEVSSGQPTDYPNSTPTVQPTDGASSPPTRIYIKPTGMPTPLFTNNPTKNPIGGPEPVPSKIPIKEPSEPPTSSPTRYELNPSPMKTFNPTKKPSIEQAPMHTHDPTYKPTFVPTSSPTAPPSMAPTKSKSRGVSNHPSVGTTAEPSTDPTKKLTDWPTATPIGQQSRPTLVPTHIPTLITNPDQPSMSPSINGSKGAPDQPTLDPTQATTGYQTVKPTGWPIAVPTSGPITRESDAPTSAPTDYRPMDTPSVPPTTIENKGTTESPTEVPTILPTKHCTKSPPPPPSPEQNEATPSSTPTEVSTQVPSPGSTKVPFSLEPSSEPSATPTDTTNESFPDPPSIIPTYTQSVQPQVPSTAPIVVSKSCEDETLGSCNEFAYTNCKLASGSRCFYYHPVASKEHILSKIEHHTSAIESLRENLGLN